MDIWKSCYDDLHIFREKGNIFKRCITSFEIISLFACALGVGITFSSWRYWQGLYWMNSFSFPFCPCFKRILNYKEMVLCSVNKLWSHLLNLFPFIHSAIPLLWTCLIFAFPDFYLGKTKGSCTKLHETAKWLC